MIQILKHGLKVYTIECPLCCCKFRCVDKDFEQTKTEIANTMIIYYSITCPDCGKVISNTSKDNIATDLGEPDPKREEDYLRYCSLYLL